MLPLQRVWAQSLAGEPGSSPAEERKKEKRQTKGLIPFTSFLFYFYSFIWLHQVLVVALRIFSCGMWTLSCGMRSSSLTRDQTLGPLHWECRVLATGSPGKPPHIFWHISRCVPWVSSKPDAWRANKIKTLGIFASLMYLTFIFGRGR